jgi:AraC-like DNA-binding protein
MTMRRSRDKPVYVGQPWRIVLRDLGLDATAVLRRAGQPPRLFEAEGSWISVDAFYDLFNATEAEAGGPDVAIRAGVVTSAELFDPAYFAAICSPDLTTALTRLGEHMRLVGPFLLDVVVDTEETIATYRCKQRPDVARLLGLSQLAFMVALARRATRHAIVPRHVTVIGSTHDLTECGEFFGCDVASGDVFEVSFDAFDASRPFLTRNDEMWETFQPGLRRRAAEAGEYRSVRDEVEEALFELLPSGRAALSDVAGELGIGERTLQRRLAAEDTSWLDVLNSTRERLARHYFESTELNATEVSFLLGFADPNSLFRAFHRWTGTTPESWRAAMRSTN